MSQTPIVQGFMTDEKEHRKRLAKGVNAALRGKLNIVTTLTLNADADSTILKNSRLSVNSYIGLMPQTANAAAEAWYVTDQNNGEATVNHANNAQTDRTFTVIIIG